MIASHFSRFKSVLSAKKWTILPILIVGWQATQQCARNKIDFFFRIFLLDNHRFKKSDVVLTDHCQIYGLPLTWYPMLF